MFDSHFHLTDPHLEIGLTAKEVAACHGVEIGACFETLDGVFALAEKQPNIYCTAGVHPEYADTYQPKAMENWVRAQIHNPKFVAIGECGLDYHRADLPNRAQQIAVFTHQIKLAHQFAKPLVIHSREAWDDTLATLLANREFLDHGVLLHCMSYTAAQTQTLFKELPEVDFYFAFGGHLTYKNKSFLHETLLAIPRDRILLETDAPYLAPEPKRGQVNRPEFMRFTAAKMAEILALPVDDVINLTTQNAYRFYKIK